MLIGLSIRLRFERNNRFRDLPLRSPAGVDYMPTPFSRGVTSQPENGGKNAPWRSLYG
jgi:hypothetical protein